MRNVANLALGGRRGVLAGDVHQAEDRLGAVPFLAKSRLSPRQSGPAQFPVGMQPVRVAGENDDPVLLAGMVKRVRHRGRGGDHGTRPAVPAPPSRDCGFGRIGGLSARRVGLGPGRRHRRALGGANLLLDSGSRRRPSHRQGTDQLILSHSMPTGDPLLLGHLGQVLFITILERICGHTEPLQHHGHPLAGCMWWMKDCTIHP